MRSVVGDSHAQAVVRAVEKSLPSHNYHVADWSMSSCQTIFGIKDATQPELKCATFIHNALELSQSIPANIPILIVNRPTANIEGPNEPDLIEKYRIPHKYITSPYAEWSEKLKSEMQNGIAQTACAFAQHRPVYMMRPIPELKLDVPRTMGRAAIIWGQERRVSITLDEYEERHRIAWAAQDRAAEKCGVILLVPRPYLCSDGRCWGDADGLPIYNDDDHLSERGGQLLIPLFKQMFNTNDLPQVSQNQ